MTSTADDLQLGSDQELSPELELEFQAIRLGLGLVPPAEVESVEARLALGGFEQREDGQWRRRRRPAPAPISGELLSKP